MEIVLLSSAHAGRILSDAIGHDPTSAEGIADLLRQEVSSRGRCPRYFAIARVCRLVAPAVTLDPAPVHDICDELERQGDVILADGGILHPPPVRIVSSGDGLFRFVCAVPSRALREAVPGEWTQHRTRRECRTTQTSAAVASPIGGVVLSPEAWAGLDTASIADAEFLRWFDGRLEAAPEPAGSLEQEEPLQWAACEVAADGARWRSKMQDETVAKLWRARHRWRHWVYAWTAGGSPAKQPFLTLHPDDGARAMYALAATSGMPLGATFERRRNDVVIRLPGWLPRAEYRYLATCANPVAAEAPGGGWTISLARFDAVRGTLASRLGLRFDEEPPR